MIFNLLVSKKENKLLFQDTIKLFNTQQQISKD